MPQTYDLILKGGTVVNHDGEGLRDIGIAGEDVVGASGHFQSAALVTGAPAPYVWLQPLTRTDQASIMKAALLPDRGAVKVAGDDARKFLNGLITSDIAKMTPARPGFAALLTPQGKIIVDFILAEAPPADRGALEDQVVGLGHSSVPPPL